MTPNVVEVIQWLNATEADEVEKLDDIEMLYGVEQVLSDMHMYDNFCGVQ